MCIAQVHTHTDLMSGRLLSSIFILKSGNVKKTTTIVFLTDPVTRVKNSKETSRCEWRWKDAVYYIRAQLLALGIGLMSDLCWERVRECIIDGWFSWFVNIHTAHVVLPVATNCNQLLVDAMIRSFVCHLLMGLLVVWAWWWLFDQRENGRQMRSLSYLGIMFLCDTVDIIWWV